VRALHGRSMKLQAAASRLGSASPRSGCWSREASSGSAPRRPSCAAFATKWTGTEVTTPASAEGGGRADGAGHRPRVDCVRVIKTAETMIRWLPYAVHNAGSVTSTFARSA
jgi:hypothetical protein